MLDNKVKIMNRLLDRFTEFNNTHYEERRRMLDMEMSNMSVTIQGEEEEEDWYMSHIIADSGVSLKEKQNYSVLGELQFFEIFLASYVTTLSKGREISIEKLQGWLMRLNKYDIFKIDAVVEWYLDDEKYDMPNIKRYAENTSHLRLLLIEWIKNEIRSR